jgi:hypothetical protein
MTMTAVLTRKNELTDTIPEFCHYEDTGCEVSAACLDCPLPQCKFDDPAWYQRNRRLARDFQVMYAIQLESLSMEEAAARFSVTVRTVFRILQRCREALATVDRQSLAARAA